jgi:hypothetical protein
MVSLPDYLQAQIRRENSMGRYVVRDQYFAEVASLLGRNKLKIAVRSAAMWIRSEKVETGKLRSQGMDIMYFTGLIKALLPV